MLAVRSALFLVVQVLSAIAWTPFSMMAWLLPPHRGYRLISRWARFITWWLRVTCNLRYEVQGLEHLDGPPAVILSKHQSAWETIAFQDFLPPHTWLLKRELLYIPFFGWGLAAAHPIAIDRGSPKQALEQLLLQGADRLARGLHIVVFPEGTRMKPGESGRYNPGGALLAVKNDAAVIAIAHNAGEFWARRSLLRKPGTIRVRISPRMTSAGRAPRELSDAAHEWIEEAMREIEGR